MSENKIDDGDRYRELADYPDGGTNLLRLLANGKGSRKDLDTILDRIIASRYNEAEKRREYEKEI